MWVRRMTKWHDEVGPFHLVAKDGPVHPACGSSFYSLSGGFEDPPKHQRCKRCVRSARLRGAA